MTEIQWTTSLSGSCMHAADAVVRGQPLIDPRLSGEFTTRAIEFRDEVRVAGLPESRFWQHLTAFAHQVENNRELAKLAVRKSIGNSANTESILSKLSGRITALERVYELALPTHATDLEHRARPIRELWESCGPGLLKEIARLTDERLIVDRAEIVLVHPALGGAGIAHLQNNSVRIEAVLTNNVAGLPEVVRLAWLISQLNSDLSMFSEAVHGEQLPTIASLAMIPPAIVAAEQLELCTWNAELAQAAIAAWIREPLPSNTAKTLDVWWDTYRQSRPHWAIALQALEAMLAPVS